MITITGAVIGWAISLCANYMDHRPGSKCQYTMMSCPGYWVVTVLFTAAGYVVGGIIS